MKHDMGHMPDSDEGGQHESMTGRTDHGSEGGMSVNHEHMDHDMSSMHGGMQHGGGHAGHHAMMVADFRRRFWVSLVISIPILLLSPLIQRFLGLESKISFTGDSYVLFVLSTAVFFYGGWPFLKGIYD